MEARTMLVLRNMAVAVAVVAAAAVKVAKVAGRGYRPQLSRASLS
jgi:hypothetical protein